MSCPVQSFANFTMDMFEAFKQKLHDDLHIEVQGLKGTVSHGGFTFTFDYEEATQILTTQCLSKPWYASENAVTSGMVETIIHIRQKIALKAQAAGGSAA